MVTTVGEIARNQSFILVVKQGENGAVKLDFLLVGSIVLVRIEKLKLSVPIKIGNVELPAFAKLVSVFKVFMRNVLVVTTTVIKTV